MNYLGGLFDGEGSAGVYRMKRGKSRMRPTVQLTMCDREGPEMLQAEFGGYIISKKVKEGNKPAWLWIVQGMAAVEVAKRLLTVSRVARKRAQLERVASYWTVKNQHDPRYEAWRKEWAA